MLYEVITAGLELRMHGTLNPDTGHQFAGGSNQELRQPVGFVAECEPRCATHYSSQRKGCSYEHIQTEHGTHSLTIKKQGCFGILLPQGFGDLQQVVQYSIQVGQMPSCSSYNFV